MKKYDLTFKTEQGNFTYRVAAIIIKDNKLLMVKHEDLPFYYTVGGRVSLNETSEEAVIREVYEETGIEFQIDKLGFIQERFLTVEGIKRHEIIFYYIMKEESKKEVTLRKSTDQPKESLHWVPLKDLKNSNVIPNFFKIKLLEGINNIEHIISKQQTD